MINFINVEAALKVIAAVKTPESVYTVTKPTTESNKYALEFDNVSIVVTSDTKLALGTVVSVDPVGYIDVVSVPEVKARRMGCSERPVQGTLN